MNGEEPTEPPEKAPDLPDPEFEPIRNFAALPQRIKELIQHGLFLTLGPESAVPVGTLSGLLGHVDKLYQAVQVNRSGQEVNRRGALAAVPGGRSLEALPSLSGSYALPLRLREPEGQLVGEDYQELEALIHLLDPTTNLEEELDELPDRIGDEVRRLYEVLASGGSNLRAEVVRDGQAGNSIEVSADEAQTKAAWLDEKTPHDLGTKTLRGRLFRIDTKKSEIRIDVIGDTEGEKNVESATFQEEQLDDLREALNHQVEMEVAVSEERRPYERSATSPTLSVSWVRRVEGD
ncbi:MAG: hypothetical protein GX537_10490 [Actinobacteria bacterium]|nr:hypothetical protein [Actinomycetota bacterium]